MSAIGDLYHSVYEQALHDAAARLEAYSMEYVMKWTPITGSENAQAGGWVILLAASEIRKMADADRREGQ